VKVIVNPEVTPIQHAEQSTDHDLHVELLIIRDCPHATLAETLARVTLNELGLPHVPVLTTVIETTSEAIRRGFTGSPSIMINGIDPWAQPAGKPALACRLHPSSTGLPSQYRLAQALCAAVLDTHRRQNTGLRSEGPTGTPSRF
jgi:hypothetical protein